MFANNEKVSWIQAQAQMKLSFIGPVLLWGGKKVQGRMGMFGIVLGMVILGVWIRYLTRQNLLYRNPRFYWGKTMTQGIGWLYEAYLILTGSFLVGKLSELMGTYLVSGMKNWIISGFLVLTALGMSQSMEARGRYGQVAWPIVMSLLLLFLLLSLTEVKIENMENMLPSVKSQEKIIKNLVSQTGWVLAIFLGMMVIPFLEVEQERPHGGFYFFSFFLGALLIILQGYFGKQGAAGVEYPIVNMMAGIRIPGNFIRRLDVIFLVVVLFGFLFTMNSIFLYCNVIGERMKIPMGKRTAAILCFVLSNVSVGGWQVKQQYSSLLFQFFLPVFAVLTVCAEIIRRNKYGKEKEKKEI